MIDEDQNKNRMVKALETDHIDCKTTLYDHQV
jgi:hypothetical protein